MQKTYEEYAEKSQKMVAWMAKEGIEAHVERLPDGRQVIALGPKQDRSRQARWDANHLITMSCRVPVETAEVFRQACQREGSTPYAVLREFVEVIVKEECRVRPARASARPGGPPRSSAWRSVGGAGSERGDAPGSPRGRSPRPSWSMPYDWEKEADASA